MLGLVDMNLLNFKFIIDPKVSIRHEFQYIILSPFWFFVYYLFPVIVYPAFFIILLTYISMYYFYREILKSLERIDLNKFYSIKNNNLTLDYYKSMEFYNDLAEYYDCFNQNTKLWVNVYRICFILNKTLLWPVSLLIVYIVVFLMVT